MKKMMKKVISVCCILAITFSTLIGCSSSTPDTTSPQSEDAPSEESANPSHIRMAFLYIGEEPADLQMVQDAVNKISIDEINVEVEFVPISLFQYGDQLNLMISGGEQLDVAAAFPSLSVLYSKGQLMPLDDLITEYGQGLAEEVGQDYLNGCRLGGEIYGIPILCGFAYSSGLSYSVDLAEELGIDMSNVTSLDDLDAILAEVHEKDPDIYAIAAKSTSASLVNQMLTCDMLSDSIGVLMDPENGTTIESLYETETYKQLALKVRDWYEKGYIMKDQASTSETLLSLIAADKAFCGITNYTPGIEMEQMSSTNGKRVKVIPFSDPLVSSTSVSVSTMCIPITCSDTTAAMKFLNLLYTNAEVINLIDWGIEGVHYVKNEDGTICYPDGVTAETSTYNIGTQFMNANELLSYVWEGNDPNLWQEKVAFEENAIASNALGFNFDSSSVKTQMTAVSNVINQYEDALGNGTVDVESTLPQFIKALKDAGIDDIITEKQKQFDEFLATK